MKPVKKIMIFIDWFYPAFKAGGQVQSCMNIIQALSGSCQFFIVTSDRDLGDIRPFGNVTLNKWVSYGDNASVYYIGNGNFSTNVVKTLLSEIGPAIVYLNSMFSWKYTIVPLRVAKQSGIEIILAPSGMLQDGAMKIKKGKKYLFLDVARIIGLFRNVRFHATDEVEHKDILERISESADVTIIPCLPPQGGITLTKVQKKVGEARFVYFSRIAEKKNLLFLLTLLEAVKTPVCLDIYGDKEDDIYYNACLKMSKRLNWHRVEFKGPVSNSLLEELYKLYHVFVLPTQGENFGYAILEALVYGKPVIISDKTPWLDLTSRKVGYDISLAKSEYFIEAINNFVKMDQCEFDTWSENAWKYAKLVQKDDLIISQYQHLFSV